MRRSAKLFLGLSTLVVAIALVAGFVIIPSPALQHIYDLDSKRVDNLDILAAAVNVYVVEHGKLPASLADLNASVKWSVDDARDVETGHDYDYIPGQDLAYSLCATFGAPAQAGTTGLAWHPSGHHCEKRTAPRPKS